MNEFIITATRSMRSYAREVLEQLPKIAGFPEPRKLTSDINGVDSLCTEHFADGEMEVVVKQSIRGKDIFLFTSCSRNEAGIGVEEAKIELYHTIDALKRAQAKNIIVIEPFVSCARSDRTNRRSSVGLWVHFKTLQSLGVNHIVTYQLHSDKSKSMFDPTLCSIDDMPALNLLKRYLCDVYIKTKETLENVVRQHWAFCSVDAGGEKLTRDFANTFGAPLVIAHKQRDYSRANSIESINILSAVPIEGKVLWIVDDMIDTAGSVQSLIQALEPLKPAEINLAAVHAVFSSPAETRLNEFSRSGLLNRIIVTDTVNNGVVGETEKRIKHLEIVPSHELAAKIIRDIVSNASMRKLMRTFSAEIYLNTPNLFNQ
ncbi:ribose-phosphate diphosphokinase [Breznakiellaceae bacterium SP9]